MHEIRLDTFVDLKMRWEYVRDNCPSDIDTLFLPALIEINKVNELVTIFCCEGHPENEDDKEDMPYVMLGCCEGYQGIEKAYRLYELFLEEIRPVETAWGVSEHTVRFDLVRRYNVLTLDKDVPEYYNVVNLMWPVTEANKLNMHSAFLNACKKLNLEQ